MSPVSRREFLTQGATAVALAAAGAALAGDPARALPGHQGGAPAASQAPAASAPGASAPAEPHRDFPTDPRARLAVATYPFRNFIDSPFYRRRNPQKPGMDLPTFAQQVVERFNVRGIETWSPHIQSHAPADVAVLRSGIEKAGVRVVNIAADLRQSVYDPDADKRRAAIDGGKQWVDVAAAIGSPSIRLHVAGVHGVPPDFARAGDSLREVADYGAAHNVIINLENDDLVSEDAFFIVRVLDHANHPWLHACPDFGNSAMSGEPAFNLDAMALMFRHALSISHMKDSEEGDGGKIYNADVPATFQIARASGYRGYFSMEMDRSGDPYAGTASLIDQSLRALG
ncbi:MAG TPA: sugar phosphate isomerase/epimerase family protein [Terriglobia bacterium]|jgi:sugar phosphate isomerase/epimerase|nr:sugar phosphate isomerase/epimerase family protein [Terriglobia bacterium]